MKRAAYWMVTWSVVAIFGTCTAQADPMGEIEYGPNGGTITRNDPQDTWTFRGRRGEVVRIEADCSTLSLGVLVWPTEEGESYSYGRHDEPIVQSYTLNGKEGYREYTIRVCCLNFPTGRSAGSYTLTVTWVSGTRVLTMRSVGGGVVADPGMGSFTYEPYSKVPIVATPLANHRFMRWTGAEQDLRKVDRPGESSAIVTVDDDRTLEAVFAPVLRTLTVSSSEGGKVATPGPGTSIYDHGDLVTVVAAADPNYRFLRWEGSGSEQVPQSLSTVSLLMNGDYELRAVFALKEYALTVSHAGAGRVAAPGEGSFVYTHGSTVSVVAETEADDPCSEFKGWTGTAVDAGKVADPQDSSTTVKVDGEYDLVAGFGPIQYPLALTVSPAGSGLAGVVGGGASFDCGSLVPVIATAQPGWQFAGWTVTPQGSANVAEPASPSTTVILSGPCTLEARFVLVKHTLTVSSTAGGSASPFTGRHDHGSVVSIAAEPDGCHRFAGWTGTAVAAGAVANPDAANTTVTMHADHTLQANFIPIQYTLSLTVSPGDAGSAVVVGGGQSFDCGSPVPVKATARTGWQFAGWTATPQDAARVAEPGNPDTTVTLTGHCTLEARFVPVKHRLTVSSTGKGSVSLNPPGGLYDYGTRVSIVAQPEACHEFAGWTGAAVTANAVADPAAASTTVTVNADYDLRATFAPGQYTLTISSLGCGTVTRPGEGTFTYDCGARVTVVATPNPGRFLRWAGTAAATGKLDDPSSPTATITIDGSDTLQAVFARHPQVNTLAAKDVTLASVSLLGTLASDGDEACDCWFRYWKEGQQMTPRETPRLSDRKSGDSFRGMITGLQCGTTYYFQAWAGNPCGRVQGEVRKFTTDPARIWLTTSAEEGGTVAQPGVGRFPYCQPTEIAVLAEPTDPAYRFWRWTGSAVDTGKLLGGDVTAAGPRVRVDATDTLRAEFVRVIPPRTDDADRAGRRGELFSTSQLWDFGDSAGNVGGLPAGLCDVAGAAPGGRLPLPGTSLAIDGPYAANAQWWPVDPYGSSSRKGLLASGGLRAAVDVWHSHATAASVWVQVIWRPYEGSGDGPFPPDAPSEATVTDIDPPRLAYRMIAQESLPYGWRRSTYAWDIAPSPVQVRFAIRGRIVVDSVVVDTYAERLTGSEEIHVDDDAPNDPGPGDSTVGDPFENGSRQRPFDSIQEAIDAAWAGARIIVHEGYYTETIDLLGKPITVTAAWLIDPGAHAPSVLDAGGAGPAVRLTHGEGSGCIVSGLTILGGRDPDCAAVLCERADATISHCILGGHMATANTGAIIACRDSRVKFLNCTITGNRVGPAGAVLSLVNSRDTVANCILWGNEGPVLYASPGSDPVIRHSNIQGGRPGVGILDADPRFVDPGRWVHAGSSGQTAPDVWVMGDYHLKSSHGRFDPTRKTWIKDAASSPCIDAGSPSSIWTSESQPNGGRANMGAWGGTDQASRSQSPGS